MTSVLVSIGLYIVYVKLDVYYICYVIIIVLGSDLYMILLDPWRMILTFNGYWELGSHVFRFGTQEIRKFFDRKKFKIFEIPTVKNLNSKCVTVKKLKVLKSLIRCVRSITFNTGIMKLICNCFNSL